MHLRRLHLRRAPPAVAADGPPAPGDDAPPGRRRTVRARRAGLGLRQSQLAGCPGGGPGLPLGIPLPLDTGEAEPTIAAHLRRTVTTRHTHCAFPGCRVPAEACHIHHLVPRARGGPTALHNLVPLCSFHHLTAVHRWGWALALHADGSATATSPDRARTRHDHDPPWAAA